MGDPELFGVGETPSGGLTQFNAWLKRRSAYVLYCSIEDHRALGMEARFRVRTHRH